MIPDGSAKDGCATRAVLIARLEEAHCEVLESAPGRLLILRRGVDRFLPLPPGWERQLARFFAPRFDFDGTRLKLRYFDCPWHRWVHALILALFIAELLSGGSNWNWPQFLSAMVSVQLVPVALARWDLASTREALRPLLAPTK